MLETIKLVNDSIGQHRERMIDVTDFIWKNPETGYREWKTSKFLHAQFVELGYEPVLMGDIPGFYADLDTGRPGPTLAILGELDSVICVGHPEADPDTGAIHACGHHTQCAYLVGVAAAFRKAHDMQTETQGRSLQDLICGKIRFIAVPAEELIELEFRGSLLEQGIIKYFGGKVEFMHRGVFDDVDAAIMVHSGIFLEDGKILSTSRGWNGCVAKSITYTGKAAHAAGGPHKAINALYAATQGMNAINAIRETFVAENNTFVHPIITEGGIAVNVIPETVRMETFVRGSTPNAIVSENKKVNRALAGAALSLGAQVRVTDFPGYMPLNHDSGMIELSQEIATAMFGEDMSVVKEIVGGGSSDMGDLSCVMPVIQPLGGGGIGIGHGEDFYIADKDIACVDSARYIAGLSVALLENGGTRLYEIKEKFTPVFASHQEYFDFVEAMRTQRELVMYDGETAAVVW